MIGGVAGLRRYLPIGAAVVAAALWATAPACAGQSVTVENAWVPWAPAVVKVHAGYMTIVNRGDAEQEIIGAASPAYERVELHGSSIKDGVSEMRPVDRVAVPANGRVAFEPAGLHLMLIGPKQPQPVGGRIDIVLRLRNGGEVGVRAEVRSRGSASHSEHRQHGGAR
jgi:periplasmic copper chaperone A